MSLHVEHGDGTVLASGDAFISDAVARQQLAERAQLVDMEGYAVAYACQRLGVPVRLVKHVSDAADESALDWPEVVDASARVLGKWVAEHAGAVDPSSVADVTTTAVPLLADSVRLCDEADGGGVDILDRRVYPHETAGCAAPRSPTWRPRSATW